MRPSLTFFSLMYCLTSDYSDEAGIYSGFVSLLVTLYFKFKFSLVCIIMSNIAPSILQDECGE